jgi:hypothetical protein
MRVNGYKGVVNPVRAAAPKEQRSRRLCRPGGARVDRQGRGIAVEMMLNCPTCGFRDASPLLNPINVIEGL